MPGLRLLIVAVTVAIAAPACAVAASPQWGPPRASPAFSSGYERGQRAGIQDAHRGDRFGFADETEYRRADAGYRSRYGSRSEYRVEFRRGFEQGYRDGYERAAWAARDRRGVPAWGDTGARDRGRTDVASETGYSDGYEAGMSDARGRRRFDPLSESRYRSGDRGYRREYGSREVYKDLYRRAFRAGYARGFDDVRRNW